MTETSEYKNIHLKCSLCENLLSLGDGVVAFSLKCNSPFVRLPYRERDHCMFDSKAQPFPSHRLLAAAVSVCYQLPSTVNTQLAVSPFSCFFL